MPICHQVETPPLLLFFSPLFTCVVLFDKEQREQIGIRSFYFDIPSIFFFCLVKMGKVNMKFLYGSLVPQSS